MTDDYKDFTKKIISPEDVQKWFTIIRDEKINGWDMTTNTTNAQATCMGSGSWNPKGGQYDNQIGKYKPWGQWEKFPDASDWTINSPEYGKIIDEYKKKAEELAKRAGELHPTPKEFLIPNGTTVLVLKNNITSGRVLVKDFTTAVTDKTVTFELSDLVYARDLQIHPNEFNCEEFWSDSEKKTMYVFRLPENKLGWTLVAVDKKLIFVR